MKKTEIIKKIDNDLLDKIMGFSYIRTKDSYEAEELCSDIVYELIKSAGKEGEIVDFYGFVWKVARNVYADFSSKKSKQMATVYEGDPEEVFMKLVAPEENDEGAEDILHIVRAIAFLTKAYRDAMILYYFEGKKISEIAKLLDTSETAVRQRLFSAREEIKKEVAVMDEIKKPVLFDKIDFNIIGTGNPSWGDPRDVCTRQLSKHIVWLCYKKPKTAKEISEELNVPMMYVEEELDILTKGENGEYGLLRKNAR